MILVTPNTETPIPYTSDEAISAVSQDLLTKRDKLAPYLTNENLDTPSAVTKTRTLQAALDLLSGTSADPKTGIAVMVDLTREAEEASAKKGLTTSTAFANSTLARKYKFAGQVAAKKIGLEDEWKRVWQLSKPAPAPQPTPA